MKRAAATSPASPPALADRIAVELLPVTPAQHAERNDQLVTLLARLLADHHRRQVAAGAGKVLPFRRRDDEP